MSINTDKQPIISESSSDFKDLLTFQMIEAGRELLSQVDKNNLLIESAFWMWIDSWKRWHFVLSSPETYLKDPRKIFRRVGALLWKMPISVTDALPLMYLGGRVLMIPWSWD